LPGKTSNAGGDGAIDLRSTPARARTLTQQLWAGMPGEGIDLTASGL
jgi:hypothetical protein